MKALHVVLAAVGGAIVGTAVGVLLAPNSGKETRQSIKSYLRSKCPFMKEDRLNALVEKIREELDEA